MTVTDMMPLDPVLALHRMRVRLGYDRRAHLAWYDREHPTAAEWPAEPVTEDATRAVVAAYTVAPAELELGEADRQAVLGVMTEDEAKWLLAFIAGFAPKVFDRAIARRPSIEPEGFATELLVRVDARDEAEYLAEPEGYCAVCGANVSWFVGHDGPQHFTGPHKLLSGSERCDLFTPGDGHAPEVAWRPSTAVGTAHPAGTRVRVLFPVPGRDVGDQGVIIAHDPAAGTAAVDFGDGQAVTVDACALQLLAQPAEERN
jgi:hypothetical protein